MGRKSGQLDIVAEKLHSISFPAQSDSDERLYLAEMVSVVISVKSNLFSQWSQIEKEVRQLNPIQSETTGFFNVNDFGGHIPFFIASYSGATSLAKLREKIESLPQNSCLEAVIVLDTKLLALQVKPNEWYYSDDTSSFFYFICQLHGKLACNLTVGENIWDYACESTDVEP